MKIIIAGAGEVGYHLAKLLTKESHSIVLIDTRLKILSRADSEMDLLTLHGSAYSLSILDKADVANTDLLIAVTSSETTNLTIATLGKQLGAKKTIARVNNSEFLKLKDRLDLGTLGIDVIISPEELASKEIIRLLRRSSFSNAFDFEFGKLTLLGVYLTDESKIIGKDINACQEYNKNQHYKTIAIERGGEAIIPIGSFTYEQGDHVFFLCLPLGIEEIREACGKAKLEVKNIMIMGGGNVGYGTAKKLSRKKNVKLIESNTERCIELADMLPETLVINDDGHDVHLLEDENISEMDAFIAVTGNSETNIMSCLVAKNHGVKKTIAMVENMDYINLSQTIGIDTLINKKLIAANNIFRYVRQADIINIAGIHGLDAEVIEIHVHENSKATKNSIGDLNLPSDAIVGGIIRKNQAWIADNNFQIEASDKVVVFALPAVIQKTLEYFS
ncbi:Trk system potassium transporter TrkA [Bacteroidia bacterium]|nr:Trk system potassium transporter TrkA [Bacteroidia bacterium]MDC1395130.1 Trk system potassium transporter TrkA [Bacteroidia bacterium]